jgi:PhoPQ-activated pathogenicity-related protein
LYGWIRYCARASFGAALAACIAAADAQTVSAPTDTAAHSVANASALQSYVAKPDDTFQWHLRARQRLRGTDVLEIDLHSQTWRGVLWKHKLFVIKPPEVADPEHGLLIIGGGRWREEYESGSAPTDLPRQAAIFAAIARELRSVVVVIAQVPFQPLFDLTEDQLIAYSFDQYLRTGDEEWPLLLPMVKSAARALDAGEAAARQEWRMPLERFTVLGGSKRGWTTWLLAAVDPRVTALAPAVIDALNMRKHFPYQTATWGSPSEAVRPYTDLNLDEVLASDAGAGLRRIVDPFEYRTGIGQPKLIVLATNDVFFPVDAANLYWDELEGPKYLLYLPNDEHSISDYRRLVPTLRALHVASDGGEPLPALDWEYRWSDDGLELCVRATPEPGHVRLWTAVAEDRDFRPAVWHEYRDEKDGPYTFDVARNDGDYTAVFAEAVFGRGSSAYTLSTNLAVLVPRGIDDIGARPTGRRGVCASPTG